MQLLKTDSQETADCNVTTTDIYPELFLNFNELQVYWCTKSANYFNSMLQLIHVCCRSKKFG